MTSLLHTSSYSRASITLQPGQTCLHLCNSPTSPNRQSAACKKQKRRMTIVLPRSGRLTKAAGHQDTEIHEDLPLDLHWWVVGGDEQEQMQVMGPEYKHVLLSMEGGQTVNILDSLFFLPLRKWSQKTWIQVLPYFTNTNTRWDFGTWTQLQNVMRKSSSQL